MPKRFVLCYELSDGKIINFEFNPNIDYVKYNKTILGIYGKQVKRRYVIDTASGELMSLRNFEIFIQNIKERRFYE